MPLVSAAERGLQLSSSLPRAAAARVPPLRLVFPLDFLCLRVWFLVSPISLRSGCVSLPAEAISTPRSVRAASLTAALDNAQAWLSFGPLRFQPRRDKARHLLWQSCVLGEMSDLEMGWSGKRTQRLLRDWRGSR